MEEWKPIKDFPNYDISTAGRVRNWRRGTILKNYRETVTWYDKVDLWKNGQRYRRYIHRLVATMFLDNPFNKPEVNHINGDKTNSYVGNLEWSTHQENMQHAYNTGLINQRQIEIIETGEIFTGLTNVARHINGSPAKVLVCLQGKRNHHKGYTFSYAD